MSRAWLVLLGAIACGKGDDPASDEGGGIGGSDGSASGADGGDGTGGTGGAASTGCGSASPYATGGVQLELDAGPDGDGVRGLFLVVPNDYDPDVPHDLVLGYPGTDWVGEQIRGYLDLEGRTAQPTIYAYLDPLWRDFPGWGTYGGWVLGPNGGNAVGNGDLVFTEAVLDQLAADLCINEQQVFVTGHSWGGDMAHVAACFLGDRITAAAPAAANWPYWFETGAGWQACAGSPAIWTFHGLDDDYFGDAGAYGEAVTEAWMSDRECDDGWEELALDPNGDCRRFSCSAEVSLCLYDPAAGHQIPSYFSQTVMDWFAEQ